MWKHGGDTKDKGCSYGEERMWDEERGFVNTLGRLLRVSVFGESHGWGVGVLIDGCPAGVPLGETDFPPDLERRKPQGKAGTPRKEEDVPNILSGVFQNHTTGAPITIVFTNKNTISKDYDTVKEIPRPGHADFVAEKRFGGYQDHRGGGHFSGRLTTSLVAGGVVAKKILSSVKIHAQLIEVAGQRSIDRALSMALEKKDSVGGVVECIVKDLPIGLGEPFFDSVESVLSHALFSIPAIKGVEFGAGFGATKMFGSQHNDPLVDESGRTKTNHAGGVVGGLSNGNDLVFRVAVKPTSSTPKRQKTFNVRSEKEEFLQIQGRHDLCIALRVPVVVEAATALVLADLSLIKQNIEREHSGVKADHKVSSKT